MSTLNGIQVKKLLDSGSIVLVDARSRANFAEESIPGAINIPLRTAKAAAKKALSQKTIRIVVHCQSFLCDSGEKLCTELKAQGYAKLSHFAGGIEEWKARGYPLRRKIKSKKPLRGKP